MATACNIRPAYTGPGANPPDFAQPWLLATHAVSGEIIANETRRRSCRNVRGPLEFDEGDETDYVRLTVRVTDVVMNDMYLSDGLVQALSPSFSLFRRPPAGDTVAVEDVVTVLFRLIRKRASHPVDADVTCYDAAALSRALSIATGVSSVGLLLLRARPGGDVCESFPDYCETEAQSAAPVFQLVWHPAAMRFGVIGAALRDEFQRVSAVCGGGAFDVCRAAYRDDGSRLSDEELQPLSSREFVFMPWTAEPLCINQPESRGDDTTCTTSMAPLGGRD